MEQVIGNKNSRLEIRITDIEKRAWIEAAKKEGYEMSEWLRGLANNRIGFIGLRAPLCSFCSKVGGGRPACRSCMENWGVTIKDCDEGRKM